MRLARSYFFSELRLGNVLKMFLFFWQSEPQRSYKHGSYSEKSVYPTVAFERGHVAAVFICLLNVGAFLSEAIVCEYFIFSHLQSITPSHQKISLSKQSRGNTLENGRSKKTRKVKTASYRLWLWLY